ACRAKWELPADAARSRFVEAHSSGARGRDSPEVVPPRGRDPLPLLDRARDARSPIELRDELLGRPVEVQERECRKDHASWAFWSPCRRGRGRSPYCQAEA